MSVAPGRPSPPEPNSPRPSPTAAEQALDVASLHRCGLAGSTRALHRCLLDSLGELVDTKLSIVWSYDPVRMQLILQAARGASVEEFDAPVLDCYRSFSGEAVERQEVLDFEDVNVSVTRDGKRFGNPSLLKKLGLSRMICVPVFNTVNQNQTLAMINLFPRDGATAPDRETLESVADNVAVLLENCLRDRCIMYANRLDGALRALKSANQKTSSQTLANLVRSALDCDETSVHLVGPDEKSVALQGVEPARPGTGTGETPPKVLECWRTNREHIDNECYAAPAGAAPREASVVVPLRDLDGQAKGVIRCVNRLDGGEGRRFRPFTYDDIAVVEAIGRAFAPRLNLLLAELKRSERLARLGHELRVPVVAFQAALERVRSESRSQRIAFQFDYLENMESYAKVMGRLLKELELLRLGPERINLSIKQPVSLYAGVIAPAVRFIRPELRARRFRPDQIQRFKGLDTLPPVWVDPELMTQVVFNLLSNAIKYFGEKQRIEDFSLAVEGVRLKSSLEIGFKDLGIGVPPGFEDKIFEYGVRAPNVGPNTAGDGLGLPIAREIVRRHGGDLVLRSPRGPTEFVITLPDGLANSPPATRDFSQDQRS